jgi:hypothetical protein
MAKRLVQAIKAKVAYEKESWRMAGAELKEIRKEHPELFRKGGQR